MQVAIVAHHRTSTNVALTLARPGLRILEPAPAARTLGAGDVAIGRLDVSAGLDGIEKKMALEPEMRGDMYSAKGIREIPHTLREAADLLNKSQMLREAFGNDVIDHYHHAAQWEISETDRVVTDFERERLLERA
jgi:hypothetical protein